MLDGVHVKVPGVPLRGLYTCESGPQGLLLDAKELALSQNVTVCE